MCANTLKSRRIPSARACFSAPPAEPGSCLFERNAVKRVCTAPAGGALKQVARSNAAGRGQWGRLSLLTFFGEAKKVSALPGAFPGSPTQRTAGASNGTRHVSNSTRHASISDADRSGLGIFLEVCLSYRQKYGGHVPILQYFSEQTSPPLLTPAVARSGHAPCLSACAALKYSRGLSTKNC